MNLVRMLFLTFFSSFIYNSYSSTYCTRNNTSLSWFNEDLMNYFQFNGFTTENFSEESIQSFLYNVANNGAQEFCKNQNCGEYPCVKANYCATDSKIRAEQLVEQFSKNSKEKTLTIREFRYEKICCTSNKGQEVSPLDKCLKEFKVPKLKSKYSKFPNIVTDDKRIKNETAQLKQIYHEKIKKVGGIDPNVYCSEFSKNNACLEEERYFYPTKAEGYFDLIQQGVCTSMYTGLRLCRGFINPANWNLSERVSAINNAVVNENSAIGSSWAKPIFSTTYQFIKDGVRILDESFQNDKEVNLSNRRRFSELDGFSQSLMNGSPVPSSRVAFYLDRLKSEINNKYASIERNTKEELLNKISKIEEIIINEIKNTHHHLDPLSQSKIKTKTPISLLEILERNHGVSILIHDSKWSNLKKLLEDVMRFDALPRFPKLLTPKIVKSPECQELLKYQTPSEREYLEEQLMELINTSQSKNEDKITKTLVYLFGEAGTGKTTQMEKMAKCAGLPFIKMIDRELIQEVFSTIISTGTDENLNAKLSRAIIQRLKMMRVDGQLVDNGVLLIDDIDKIFEIIEGAGLDDVNAVSSSNQSSNNSSQIMRPLISKKDISNRVRKTLIHFLKELSDVNSKVLKDEETKDNYPINRLKIIVTSNSGLEQLLHSNEELKLQNPKDKVHNPDNPVLSRVTPHEYMPPDITVRRVFIQDSIRKYINENPEWGKYLEHPSCQKIIESILAFDEKHYVNRSGKFGIRGLVDNLWPIFINKFNILTQSLNETDCTKMEFDPEKLANNAYTIQPSIHLVREETKKYFEVYQNDKDKKEILAKNPIFQVVFEKLLKEMNTLKDIDKIINIQKMLLVAEGNLVSQGNLPSSNLIKEKLGKDLSFLQTSEEGSNLVLVTDIINQVLEKSKYNGDRQKSKHFYIDVSDYNTYNPIVFEMMSKITDIPICDLSNIGIFTKIINEFPLIRNKFVVEKEVFLNKFNHIQNSRAFQYKLENMPLLDNYKIEYRDDWKIIIGFAEYLNARAQIIVYDPNRSSEREDAWIGFRKLEDINSRDSIMENVLTYCFNKDEIFKKHPNKSLGLIIVKEDKNFGLYKKEILHRIETHKMIPFKDEAGGYFDLQRNTFLILNSPKQEDSNSPREKSQTPEIVDSPSYLTKGTLYPIGKNAQKLYCDKFIQQEKEKIITKYNAQDLKLEYSASEKALYNLILDLNEENINFSDIITLVAEHVVIPFEQRLRNALHLNLDSYDLILEKTNESNLRNKIQNKLKK